MLALLLSLSGTTVELLPSPDPLAVAEVVMHNIQMNGPQDDGDYTLELDGLIVGVEFQWEMGAAGEDKMILTPPEGVTCLPESCEMLVPEMQKGTILLFDFVGY